MPGVPVLRWEYMPGVPSSRWSTCLAFPVQDGVHAWRSQFKMLRMPGVPVLLPAGVDVDGTVVVELKSTAFTSAPACLQSASAERIIESRKGDESHSSLATSRWEVCSSNLRYDGYDSNCYLNMTNLNPWIGFEIILACRHLFLGCVPSAAVAVCWGGGGRGRVWTEWKTPVKTLPCRSYVANGNEWNWIEK